MTRQRRYFDPSFKLEVVRMIKEQGLSVSNVSQTMDIGETAIRRWLTQYEAEQGGPARSWQTVDAGAAADLATGTGEPSASWRCRNTKKGIGLLCPRAEVSYRLIDELQTKATPVAQSCRVLGVSRSGFYEAKRRAVKPRICKTSVHVRAAFAASGRSYGSRRLVTALANQGVRVGRYKVRSLMQQAALKPVWKRKFVHTPDSKHPLPVAPNVLARQFNPTAPNVAYASDITYIRTRAGWVYLPVVLDLFSRKVVGWAMAPSMPASLVCDVLRMAVQQRRPSPGLFVHSDRGSQYASDLWQALLADHGFVCSMRHKGNCWDNAAAERFFLNLRMERVWQRDYANHAEAQCDVADYIVVFYNTQRLHSTLGNMPPSVYERTMATKKPIVVS